MRGDLIMLVVVNFFAKVVNRNFIKFQAKDGVVLCDQKF